MITAGRDTFVVRVVAEAIQTTHLLHKGKTNEEYEKIRQVYYPVLQRVQNFFVNNCIGKDYCIVNENVLDELIQAHVCAPDTNTIIFRSDDEVKKVQAYVYKCPYPASIDEMEQFFTELATGKLAFLRQYPLDKTGGITLLDYVTPFLNK